MPKPKSLTKGTKKKNGESQIKKHSDGDSTGKKLKKEKKKKIKLESEVAPAAEPSLEKSKKSQLLSDDDNDDNEANELTINAKYAENYQKKKKRAELHRVKQEYIKLEQAEMDKSESETEDEDATMFEQPEWEDEFLKLLPRIAAKDRSILKKQEDLFHVDDANNDDDDDDDDAAGPSDITTAKENPKLQKLKEKLMTGNYGMESDEEEEDSAPKDKKLKKSKLTPAEEESKLRLELLKAAESDDDDTLFVKKKKSKSQLKKEQEDFIAFEKKHAPVKEDEDTDMNLLKQYWKSKELNENESFLRSYILNRGWLDSGKIGDFDDNRRHEVSQAEKEKLEEIDNLGEHDSTDEEALEAAERFEEEQARFRHQELCPTIMGQKRNVEESVRKKDTRRAEKRKKLKERKREEKETKGQELVRLQKDKRKEIIELLGQISKETGSKLGRIEKMDVDSLGRAMQQLDQDLESEKNMELLEKREKLDLLMEEYYKAHYEDVIGDDTFTRFNYIKVPKQTFGLSLDEIVFKDESNLKALAPSKHLAPYNEEVKSNTYWHQKKWNIQQEADHKFNRPDFHTRSRHNNNKPFHKNRNWDNNSHSSKNKGNKQFAQKKIQKRPRKE